MTLAAAVAEIEAAEAPDGVEPELWGKLTAELARVIEERVADKLACIAPTGAVNVVDDLYLYGDDSAGYRLEWTYLNTGDLNLDGLVSVNDLTPIGQHFNANRDSPNWPEACVADANGDGAITISDITPLGQHFLSFVADYQIYGGDSVDGSQVPICGLSRPPAPASLPFEVCCDLGSGGYRYYWVVPLDADGEEGVPSEPSIRSGDPAEVVLGEDEVILTEIVGIDGGEFWGPSGTALEEIRFSFPPGAVAPGTGITLGANDGTVEPAVGTFGGRILTLDAGEVQQFDLPVEIRLPYWPDQWSNILVPFAIDDVGGLHMLGIAEHTATTEHVTFITFYPGRYTWIAVPLDFDVDIPWFTTYRPGTDGFQIRNPWSPTSPGGQCAGMCVFSRWYFSNHAQTQGHLFNRFMYPVGSHYTGQHIIASRAQTSVSRVYGQAKEYYLYYEEQASDEVNYLAICSALENTGCPVVVGLTVKVGRGGHAALAYGYDSHGLWVYDPLGSYEERHIDYSPATKTFAPYTGHDKIYYAGDNTAIFTCESFDNILHDANAGFTNNGFAEVHVESHTDGELVATGTADISGYVQSAMLLANRMEMYVDGFAYNCALPESGAFAFSGIPISAGNNYFKFAVWGTSQRGESFIPVEYGYELRLVGTAEPPVLGVTLVWDKTDTDMDLYVIDPTGDVSWFNNWATADGATLLGNVTDGFGPEYWVIGWDNTIRYGQEYVVKAHYRDDNGQGGVTAQTRIRFYEGTDYEEFVIYPSWFWQSDHDNTDPLASGYDWKVVARIVPVNHYASTLAGGRLWVEHGADGVPVIYIAPR